MNNVGKVIVLNGASSSGKTTLAKMLQEKFTDVYLHCTSDMFWDMTPAAIPAGSVNFPNMKRAMARSVRALADTGHNVIVDTVHAGEKSHLEISEVLQGIHWINVKVHCDLPELNRRELARGNRKIGLAESQIHTAHEGVVYDLEVDTTKHGPEECAQPIISCISEETI